jgi:hypothetical protein
MQKQNSGLNGWVIGLCAIVALFVALVALGSSDSSTPTDPAKRIEESCKREFPGDDDAITRCRIQLAVEAIEKNRDAQMERARAGAR